MNEAVFSVSGMTCAACSGSITEALEKLPSVSSAAVSLLTNEAKVAYSGNTNWQELLETIESCGFDASLVSVTPQVQKTHVTSVNISGMTCAACSSSITEALESIPGVNSAAVSLLSNSAKITHSASVSAQTLLTAIEDCGFDAVLETTSRPESVDSVSEVDSVFNVEGMTCGSCSASLTEALEKLSSVVSASVSHLTNTAVVTHSILLSSQEIVACIEECGFEASLVSTKPKGDSAQSDIEDLTLRISGVDEDTDFHALHYNIEATLKSMPGIEAFQTLWKAEVDAEELLKNTSDLDPESLADELRLSINTSLVGVRQVVDALNSRDEAFSFDVLNAVDQSLNSQMKLLSKEKDIQYWRSNFYASVLLGLPVIFFSLVDDTSFWKSLTLLPGLYVISVAQLILATLILVFLGSIFFRKFGVFIRNRGKNANMDVLVCISTSVSYIFSLLSIFLSVWTGQAKRPPKVLFDTVAMLISFVSFGKWIENKAKGATSSALSKLISLTPTTCEILTDDWEPKEQGSVEKENGMEKKEGIASDMHTRVIPIDLIQKGDIAVVSAGAKIPADGQIIQGSTEIDESIITGESLPVFKNVGDTVIGGSINGPFLIYMRVSGAGKNSQLHRIINVVKDSQVNKAPVQRFADYIAARFVLFVLTLSLGTLIFWLLCSKYYAKKLPNMFLKEENGKYYVCLKLAISVIVVACPCALGLAAPTAVMVGTGVGATHGALIKGGDVLEKANSINIVLFDKTGTLTKGDLQIVRSKVMGAVSDSDWWALVGSVEVNSEHPTGRAIARRAKSELGLAFEEDTLSTSISDFQVLSGLGVSARVLLNGVNYNVTVGNKKLIVRDFKEARIGVAQAEEQELAGSFASVSHVVIDGVYCGYMELSDSVKSCTRDTIQYLQKIEHYQVGMVTGDNHRVACKIGRELGIPEGNIFSEVSPIEKDLVVEDLRRRFGGTRNVSIAFVGDGINDAPALVRADIGMAISSGTDIAMDSAEIVLMGSHGKTNDLYGVVTALQISQASFHKIKWNFFGATIYNLFMLPFAMGCFLKFGLMLSPVTAAAAMACSSLTVVLNSLNLKSWTPPNIREAVETSTSEWEPDFTLKHSTLEEFNAIKRGNFRSFKTSFLSKFKLKNLSKKFSRGGDYELIGP